MHRFNGWRLLSRQVEGFWSIPFPRLRPNQPAISREEFDALKKEVADMKELLKRAKAYDERNGEPNCEIDEKMDLLRRVAKLVGVSLDDVLGAKSQ